MESAFTRVRGLLLLVLCLGLGASLYYLRRTAVQQQQRFLVTINQFSNRWHDACLKLTDQKLVNSSLERNLSTALQNATAYSNQLRKLSADFNKARQAKDAAIASAQRPDPKLAELEDERDGLTLKLNEVSSALAKLDCEMIETQRKLQASEGDREALLKELRELQAERTALMRQFTDINLVREQLRKLKAEQAVSRRLEWIRRGTYGNYRGAELLHKQLASAPVPAANYDLNVEIRRNTDPKPAPAAARE
jgi:chromosome segregation ATPase